MQKAVSKWTFKLKLSNKSCLLEKLENMMASKIKRVSVNVKELKPLIRKGLHRSLRRRRAVPLARPEDAMGVEC